MGYSRESRCNSGATARGAEEADPIARVKIQSAAACSRASCRPPKRGRAS